MVPHLGGWGSARTIIFFWFSKKLKVNYRTCMVVDKNTDTYGYRLVDLRTYWQYTDSIIKYGPIIHGSLDKPRTYNSRTWHSTGLLFTDLTKHGTLFKLRTPLMIYEKKKTRGPRATGRSPEWHSHCRYADVQKNRFSRRLPWRTSWISDWHDFSYFWSTSHPNVSYEVWSLSVQEKKLNIDFQDGGHGGHLGFLIRTILAIFDLQVTLMLPTKFRVKWLLGLGEEAKNRFSIWPPWRPSWIYDRHDFSYFWSTSHPNASYQVSSQLVFRFRRSEK